MRMPCPSRLRFCACFGAVRGAGVGWGQAAVSCDSSLDGESEWLLSPCDSSSLDGESEWLAEEEP